jgi:transglutaminase-like putative cysteine protease
MTALATLYSTEMEPRTGAVSRLFPWRDAVTLLIVLAVSLSVVASIDNAGWVEDMPSLYPIALFGIATGYVLARLPWRTVFIYPAALLVGASGLLVQVLAVTPGDGLKERSGEMVLRMRLWLDALTGGGISSDALPVIVLLLVLTWLAAYYLAWSTFRWHNPWIGLVPGGLALLVNISYLPGQSSPAFVVFVIAAILLVSRTHLDAKMKEWRRTRTSYPGSLHFFSLNQTLWATLVLVGVAWLTPLAGQTGPFPSIWRTWTNPVADRFAGLSRVFSAVEGKKGMPLDRYASFLPYRGYFEAVEGPIMTVKASESGLLRATVYDVYTSSGWKTGERDKEPLRDRTANLPAILDEAAAQYRQPAAIEVTVEQPLPIFVAPGEPLAVDQEADVETAANPSDVTSLRPAKSLKPGDTYTAVGLVSTASVEALRASGSDYPSWVTDRYLQLPDDLPPGVAKLAREIAGETTSPYDLASQIEWYLRGYPVELQEEAPPSNVDAAWYFLAVQRRGYPLYHASAMVVMLRTLGVPARLAVGFALPQYGGSGEGIYHVDGRNALAWPEVYFSGLGWIPFSPSRAYSVQTAPLGESPTDSTGTISTQEILDMFPAGGANKPVTPEEQSAASLTESPTGSPISPWLAVPLLLLAMLSLMSAAGLRYAWNRGLSGLSRPAQLLEKTRRLSSWAGVGPRPSQTPREFLGCLRDRLPDAPDVSVLVDAYERVEFGQKSFGPNDDAKLDALWKRLRPSLLRRMLRRGGNR